MPLNDIAIFRINIKDIEPDNVFILFSSFLSNAITYQCTCSRNRKQIPIKLPVFVCYYGFIYTTRLINQSV